MRLRAKRRRRIKSPCRLATVTVAGRPKLGLLIMQPYIAFKLLKKPNMFLCSSFNATKSSATVISMAHIVA